MILHYIKTKLAEIQTKINKQKTTIKSLEDRKEFEKNKIWK